MQQHLLFKAKEVDKVMVMVAVGAEEVNGEEVQNWLLTKEEDEVKGMDEVRQKY